MTFATKMKETKNQLEKLGFEVLVTKDLEHVIANPNITADLDLDLQHCIEEDIFGDFLKLIEQSDALLVLNYPKNGIDGYIGTSVIIEMGVGFYLHKKLYLINELPDYHEVRWAHEIAMMQPTCIEGDLKKIK